MNVAVEFFIQSFFFLLSYYLLIVLSVIKWHQLEKLMSFEGLLLLYVSDY